MKWIYRLMLSASSGILLSLAWLGFPGWILFIALVPLLILDQFFVEHKTAYRSVSFWGHAFLTVLIWNLLTTWWIVHATASGAAMAIITNSFLMSLVWWLVHIARRNFQANLGYIALFVFWISFEYFHFHWDIEWPWLNLGNGFANNVKIIQWYEYTGALGGTLWVLIVNVLVSRIVRNFIEKVPALQSVVPGLFLTLTVLVPVILSFVIYNSYVEKENPRNIVIVQPNIDPYSEAYDLEAENGKLEKFIGLAKTKADNSTDFIIGPETVFENPRYWNEDLLQSNYQLRELNNFLQQYPRAEMVFGVSSYKVYPDRQKAPATARTRDGVTYDMFNTALFLGKDGLPQIYHKSILVVGVEKMPFRKYLGFLGDWVINIGGTSNSLGRQKEPTNFVAKDSLNVAPVICYESVFGEYVTGYIKKGAQFIFIITNDGWWKNTPGYRQHKSFARLRAIETRRSIARAANTGISCFINQRGDILQQTGWWVEDAISASINANNELTFYVKYGDFIARVSLFLGALLLLNLIAQGLIKRQKKSASIPFV